MSSTGLYAKGAAKRDEILQNALEVFAEEGYRGTSLREVARRSGLSLTGVMHYFDSKEHLLTEVIRRRDEGNRALWDRPDLDPVERLVRVMSYNSSVPGMVELYTTLMAAASDPAHPAHTYMTQRLVTVRQRIRDGLRELQLAGEASPDLDLEAASFSIAATIEGIELHWLLDRSIDMGARVRTACAPYLHSPTATPPDTTESTPR